MLNDVYSDRYCCTSIGLHFGSVPICGRCYSLHIQSLTPTIVFEAFPQRQFHPQQSVPYFPQYTSSSKFRCLGNMHLRCQTIRPFITSTYINLLSRTVGTIIHHVPPKDGFEVRNNNRHCHGFISQPSQCCRCRLNLQPHTGSCFCLVRSVLISIKSTHQSLRTPS